MKKVFIAGLLGFLIFGFCVNKSSAGEVDLLLEKLVEKGVLSSGEAQKIKTETKEESRRQIAAGKHETLPKWIQATKFAGDFRARFQWDGRSNGALDRTRGRFRLRFGFDSRPYDQLKIGFRLASGSPTLSNGSSNGIPEQTSTNQTYQDSFANKSIWIDQAYLEYTPFKTASFSVGKIKNPFLSTDLMWDQDINPEGGAIKYTNKIPSAWTGGMANEYFFTFGGFPMTESSSELRDTNLVAAQVGASMAAPSFVEDKSEKTFKVASAIYDFLNIKGRTIQNVSPGYLKMEGKNTLTGISDDLGSLSASGSNAFVYNYVLWDSNGEYTPAYVTLPFIKAPFNKPVPLTFLGNYIHNFGKGTAGAKPADANAWLGGVRVGKVSAAGDYELGYNYRVIGRDAVLAIFSDSDFHLGGVNAKGHKVSFNYGILPNSTLGLTVFSSERFKKLGTGTNANNSDRINTVMLDWMTKF